MMLDVTYHDNHLTDDQSSPLCKGFELHGPSRWTTPMSAISLDESPIPAFSDFFHKIFWLCRLSSERHLSCGEHTSV
jgi:hypothetical protein